MIPRHTAIELRLRLQAANAPHLIESLGDDAAVADDLFHGMIELPKMHALITAPVSFQLPVGDHSLVLTGKVKHNSAQSSSALNVSRVVHVMTSGCSSN